MLSSPLFCLFFFFQAEDGIRDHAQSRGLGDVYKRQALLSALRLNDGPVLDIVYSNIPTKYIATIVQNLPPQLLERLLNLIADSLEKKPNVQYNLKWLEALFLHCAPYFKNLNMTLVSNLRNLYRNVLTRYENASKIAHDNIYMLEYLISHLDIKEEADKQSDNHINGLIPQLVDES
eukprot:TRINITY_DN6490_c0_g2_i4.p2 TRINITY_DN6490_c0_g2~~TRINITY_DN6490_c0_g2_i4.p2  ORF type:complete len:177 (-),score=43.77 TRINITY_DN6490_c0_g2_i4:157-687(-)